VNGVKVDKNNSKPTIQKKTNNAARSLSSAPVAQLCGCGKEKKDETQNVTNPFIPKQSFWSPADTVQAKLITGVKQLKSAPSFPSLQINNNKTGLPNDVKSGVEQLSGVSLDDVKVHYNSSQPAQLHAHAYAQGTDIHVAPGQEMHLPHEAWHVIQQKQGRVKATKQLKDEVPVNDDKGLEKEADLMGAKAVHLGAHESATTLQLKKTINSDVAQLAPFKYSEEEKPMLSVDKLSRNLEIQDKKKENKEAFKYADSEKKEETVKNIAKGFSGNQEGELGNLEDIYQDLDYSHDEDGMEKTEKRFNGDRVTGGGEVELGGIEDVYQDLDYSYDKKGMEKTHARVGADQFVGGRFNENTLGIGSSGYKGSRSDELIDTSKLLHTTGSAGALGNIEKYGIDPRVTRTDNRFGQGYYVTSDENTSSDELSYHDMKAFHSLKYNTGEEGGGKILDLTKDKSDKVFTEQYPQGIRRHALKNNFNGVAYKSQRGAGVNFAVYNEFQKTLGSRDKAGTKTWTDEERASMGLNSEMRTENLPNTLEGTEIYGQAGQTHGFVQENPMRKKR